MSQIHNHDSFDEGRMEGLFLLQGIAIKLGLNVSDISTSEMDELALRIHSVIDALQSAAGLAV